MKRKSDKHTKINQQQNRYNFHIFHLSYFIFQYKNSNLCRFISLAYDDYTKEQKQTTEIDQW